MTYPYPNYPPPPPVPPTNKQSNVVWKIIAGVAVLVTAIAITFVVTRNSNKSAAPSNGPAYVSVPSTRPTAPAAVATDRDETTTETTTTSLEGTQDDLMTCYSVINRWLEFDKDVFKPLNTRGIDSASDISYLGREIDKVLDSWDIATFNDSGLQSDLDEAISLGRTAATGMQIDPLNVDDDLDRFVTKSKVFFDSCVDKAKG